MTAAALPEHSPIAISAAERWGPGGNCTGSVQMAAHFPDRETEEAREGTAAHELAARMIYAAAQAGVAPEEHRKCVGATATNGVVLTEAMFDGACMFAALVISVMRSVGVFVPGGEGLGVEERVHAPTVHPMFYGTLDARVFDSNRGILYLWDFKYGISSVEVYENWQLIGYAIAWLESRGFFDGRDEHIEVVLCIVQPRNFHGGDSVQTWRYGASDLRGWRNQFANNAGEAFSENAVCRSGAHCKNCPARIGCEAAETAGVQLYEAARPPMPENPTPSQLGRRLTLLHRAIEQLKALYKGAAAEAEARSRSGTPIPGWQLEPKFGRQTWKNTSEEIIKIGRAFQLDLSKPDVKTPAEAKKAGLPEEVVKSLSTVPNRGVALTPITSNQVKKAFEK